MKQKGLLIGLLLFLPVTQSFAAELSEGEAVRLIAGGQLIYDDNIFRLNDRLTLQEGLRRSDLVQRINAGFTARARLGLQTLSAQLSANRTDFASNSFLSFTGGNGLARGNWQIGSSLSGTAAYSVTRVLAAFGEQQRETQDLLTTRGPSVSAALKVALDHTLGVELSQLQTRRSSVTQRALENDATSISASWTYRSTSDSEVGVRVRRSEAEYLNQGRLQPQFASNDFSQRELLAFVKGQLGAVSRWSAEAGYAKRIYKNFADQDFNGPIAKLGLDWRPSEKLGLTAGLTRQLVAPEYVGTAYSLSSVASLAATWAATSTVNVRAAAQRERRKYEPAATLASTQTRNDTLQTYRLSAAFEPSSTLQLTAGIENGRRQSSVSTQTYRYNQASIGAEVSF